jgi:hypothetical protein
MTGTVVTPAAAVRAAVRIADEVVYGYGVVGAHLHGPDRSYARLRLEQHEQLRDDLRGLGVTTPRPAAAYTLPFPVIDARTARRLAIRLEDAAARAAYAVVSAAATDSASRRLAVSMLANVATAAAHWRARAGDVSDPAFPGQPSGVDSQPSTTPTISPSSSTTASGSTS